MTSAADGSFSFITFPQTYDITLRPPSGAALANTVVNGVAVSGTMVRNLALEPALVFSGVLSFSDGTLAPGFYVSVRSADGMIQVGGSTTDDSGHFTIPLQAGTYRVDVSSMAQVGNLFPGINGTLFASSIISSLVVTGNTSKDIVLPIARLTGKTTDPNGVPVGGVYISFTKGWFLDGTSYNAYNGMTSAADGSYSFITFPQSYDMSIHPPSASGFANSSVNGVQIAQKINQNFVLPRPDSTPPKVLSGPTLSALKATTATVEWQTDEPAKGTLTYGLGSPSGTTLTISNPGTLQSVPLMGLSPDSDYQLQLALVDLSGNGPTQSRVVSFRTKTTADAALPVFLEGPIMANLSTTTATVTWQTDVPSTGNVKYGLGSALDHAVEDATLGTTHRVVLPDLTPTTGYSVQVEAKDGSGKGPALSPVLTFTTAALADQTPPVLTEGPLVVDLTAREATVSWRTDEPASSGVSWNDGTLYNLVTDETLTLVHNVRITGLTPGIAYAATVSSKDGSQNGPTLGGPVRFTTQPLSDTTAPVITEGPMVVNLTDQSAAVLWRTDEPSDAVVTYGVDGKLTESAAKVALSQYHYLALPNLLPATTYTFQVASKDAAGNGPTSKGPLTFTTDLKGSSPLLSITVAPSLTYLSNTSATLSWETSAPADSVVEYGPNPDRNLRWSDPARTTQHQASLVNLIPGMTYYVTVISRDISGQVVSARLGPALGSAPIITRALGEKSPADLPDAPPVAGFTTGSIPDRVPPVLTSGPTVTYLSNTSAVVNWTTDKPADSSIEFGPQGQAMTRRTGDIHHDTVHTLVLTQLNPSSTLVFRVASTDPSGNGPTTSSTQTLTTRSVPDLIAPVIQGVPQTSQVSGSSALLAWMTDKPATTQVEYRTSTGTQVHQLARPGIGASHGIWLTGLTANTAYLAWAISVDVSGNRSASEPVAFTTGSSEVPASHLISGNAGSGGTTLAYTDGAAKTVAADSSGAYSLTVPSGWSGTVTPAKVGLMFTPANRSYTNLQSPQTGQDYTAQPNPAKVTWASPAAITYPTPLGNTQLSATANMAGSFTYDPPKGKVLNAGKGQGLSVSFMPADTAFPPVSATVTLDVNTASQTITFAPVVGLVAGGAAMALQATSSAGLPVSFSSSEAKVISLTGAQASPVAAGTTILTATQSGDANHQAAPEVSQTVTVAPSATKPSLSLATLSHQSITADSVLNVGGQVSSPNGIQSVTVNGTAVEVQSSGTFSFPVKLTTGSNSITVVAADKVNQSTTLGRAVTLDETVPLLVFSSPADNASLATSTLTVSGTVTQSAGSISDPVSGVTYTVGDGAAFAALYSASAFSFPVEPKAGINHLEVTATTGGGKRGQASLTFSYQPPFSLSVTDPPKDLSTSSTTYLLKGTVADNGGAVSITVKAGAAQFTPSLSGGAFQQQISLDQNQVWPILVTGLDGAGRSLSIQRNIIKTLRVVPTFALTDMSTAGAFASGAATPTSADLSSYDVAPLVSGVPSGDGKIDVEDLVVILRKALGLPL